MNIKTMTLKVTVKKRWYPLLFIINIPYFLTGKFPLLPFWAVEFDIIAKPELK